MEKSKIVVKIRNTPYTIITDETSEYVNKVADYVDDSFREIEARFQTLPTHMVATLGAISICDELFKVKAERNELRRIIKSPTYALSNINADLERITDEYNKLYQSYETLKQRMLRILEDDSSEFATLEEFEEMIKSFKARIKNSKKEKPESNQYTIE